jgi:hypothetical protein
MPSRYHPPSADANQNHAALVGITRWVCGLVGQWDLTDHTSATVRIDGYHTPTHPHTHKHQLFLTSATATSPTIFSDAAETLSMVS